MNFSAEQIAALRKAYEKAIRENKEIFIFQEQAVLTAYAKYLLEFVELGVC